MKNPNIRSAGTYFEMNWQPIVDQVSTFENEQEGFIHMADIIPTHARSNSLWVLAYDDYPMTSIFKKEEWIPYGVDKEFLFVFYHDAYLRAAKLDHKGKVKEELKRVR